MSKGPEMKESVYEHTIRHITASLKALIFVIRSYKLVAPYIIWKENMWFLSSQKGFCYQRALYRSHTKLPTSAFFIFIAEGNAHFLFSELLSSHRRFACSLLKSGFLERRQNGTVGENPPTESEMTDAVVKFLPTCHP